VISGGASVTMILTSTAIAQPRLQDRASALDIGPSFRGIGRLREVEVVPGQRDHEIGEIVETGAFDRAPGAQQAGGIVAEDLELLGAVSPNFRFSEDASS
jgi:hypothetical protein